MGSLCVGFADKRAARRRHAARSVDAKAERGIRPRKEEQSNLITQELLFFLFQQACVYSHASLVNHASSVRNGLQHNLSRPDARGQECDAQLMRALNLQNYDAAQDVRDRRQQVDEALAMLQVCHKGLLPHDLCPTCRKAHASALLLCHRRMECLTCNEKPHSWGLDLGRVAAYSPHCT